MAEERIRNIEARVQASPGIPAETRAEILELLASLRESLQQSGTAAPPVLGEEAPATEPAREEGAPRGSVGEDLQGLSSSVEHLESSHPQLTASLNRLALALSNMGI